MPFTAEDNFFRRFFKDTHLKFSAPNGWVLSDGLFKYHSVVLDVAETQLRRCSVDHEEPSNSTEHVVARWRAEKPRCGVTSLGHPAFEDAQAHVAAAPEFGNNFHCNAEWPMANDQVTLFKLAAEAKIVCWPPELEGTDPIQVLVSTAV